MRDLELVVRAAKRSAHHPQLHGARGCRLTTHLGDRVRALLEDRAGWGRFPGDVREWLEMQDWRSPHAGAGAAAGRKLPASGEALNIRFSITFEGWNANQSLGMLITRRMEDQRALDPLGFVAKDYALAVWSLKAGG